MSESTVSPSKATSSEIKKEKFQFEKEEYLLRKRLPARYPTRVNDIYVNNQTNFKAQLARCFKCLETENCIYIHGLGAATAKAVNLALQLQLKSAIPLETRVNTSTVNLIGKLFPNFPFQTLELNRLSCVLDDFVPQRDDRQFHSEDRQNSAVHIQVSKIDSLKAQQQ